MRMNARTKLVTVDGETFEIAALSMAQADRLQTFAGNRELELVRIALDNAADSELEPWTIERVRRDLDLVTLGALKQAALALRGSSGLIHNLSKGGFGKCRFSRVSPTSASRIG